MELFLDDLSYTWSLVGVWDKILVNFGKNLLSIFVKTTKNFQIYHYRLIQFYKTGSIISKLQAPKFVNGSS